MDNEKDLEFKRGIYLHFKGTEYEALGLATHSETLEPMVIYRATEPTGDQRVWARPLSMWNETFIRDGKIIKRFTLLQEYDD